ncbi:MAG: hypothetical protein ABL899_03140 [Nitrospira sp.]
MRYWDKGSRNVLVLGPVTFKFPKLWLSRLAETIRTGTWWWYKNSLSVSFGENLVEAKWFFRNKPKQVVPCVLPLVVVNAYPTVRGVGALKVWEYINYEDGLRNFSTEFRLAFSNQGASHTFEHNDNYALHNGEAKLLDYGAPGVMELIVNHNEELARFLDAVREYTEKNPTA